MYMKNLNSTFFPEKYYGSIKLALSVKDLKSFNVWIWSNCDEKLQNTKLSHFYPIK